MYVLNIQASLVYDNELHNISELAAVWVVLRVICLNSQTVNRGILM